MIAHVGGSDYARLGWTVEGGRPGWNFARFPVNIKTNNTITVRVLKFIDWVVFESVTGERVCSPETL